MKHPAASPTLGLALLACLAAACGPGNAGEDRAATDATFADTAPRDSAREAAQDAPVVYPEAGAAPCLPAGNAASGMAVGARLCARCHFSDLGGGIVIANPLGPNLHNDGSGAGAWWDCDLQNAVRRGRRPDGFELCAQMPRWSTTDLTDADLADLVAYLRTLTAPGRFTAVCN